MNANLTNSFVNKEEEKLASGDACCTDNLVLSPSLTDLLPLPNGEQQQHQHDIWKYPVVSLEKLPEEGLMSVKPKFVPIGSLRKTVNQDSSKQEKMCKGPKTAIKSINRNKNLKGSHSDCFTPLENLQTLKFVNVMKLFSCQVCNTSPMIAKTVHSCKIGHQVCGDCFDRNSKCIVCSEPLDSRNLPVEEALQKLKLLRPQLFSPEYFYQPNTEHLGSVRLKRSACQSSHKPVKCPHLACHKTVAYNGFLQHFKFDHSTVPVITTAPECPYKFFLTGNTLNTTARVVIVFRVSVFQTGLKKIDGDPVICCLQSVLVQVGCVESLAIWCSSIYEGTLPLLAYTLKSPGSRRSVSYRGPLSSLHEKPDDILRDGRCLVVPAETMLQGDSVNMFKINFFING